MTEILWHGRGGQGAFTAAKLLGAAYSLGGEEKYALAFPSFGPERRGAPIRAFTKLDTKPIGDRSEIEKADKCIYLDDTLFTEKAFSELKEDGVIIINSRREYSDKRVIAIDADGIAKETLGRPITNTVMLGLLGGLGDTVSVDEVVKAIEEQMPQKLHSKNIEAVKKAAEKIKALKEGAE